jgi:hypothetical protein
MRWITTLLLAVLVAGGAVWLALGSKLTDGAADVPSASLTLLREQVKADTLKGITRTQPGQEAMTLTRAADGTWSQPGNWPVRREEAEKLAKLVSDIRTRFQPVAMPNDKDLKPFGLDASQKPVTLKVDGGSKTLTLVFGQPAVTANESAFSRPTYLRIDDQPELLRLGPDVFAGVTRPVEDYRRRQLFPDLHRVKVVGAEAPGGRLALPADKVASIKADGPNGGFKLKRVAPNAVPQPDPEKPSSEPSLAANRVADSWELAEAKDPTAAAFKPLQDHVDPAKLRSVLTAVTDLWAEGFITGKTPAETGLEKPARSLTITYHRDGFATILQVGNVSRTVVKEAPPPAQPFNPQQPPQQPKIEQYYFAKLDNNPLVFELKGDKLNDLFTAAEDLRDANLARFETADVTELTIAAKDKPAIKLTKKKGNKDAEKDDDKVDRWYAGDRLAEAPKVTELLDALNKLEAKAKEDRIDDADAKKLADLGFDDKATKVTVTAAPKDGPMKTFTFTLGKVDAEKKKVNVQVAGVPRVDVVPDDFVKLVDRPALAYRGRRLFDTAEAKLTGIGVTPSVGEAFEIKEDASKKWQLVKPIAIVADDAKSAQMAGDLSRLEVMDYVDDAPKPEDFDKKYGLAKPTMTVSLAFTGTGAKPATLEIGNSPEFKPEVYARLAGSNSVFTLPKDSIEKLKTGAVTLTPLQLWQTANDKITSVEIDRAGGEKYKLSAAGGDWKIVGAFEAPVPAAVAQPVLSATANVKAERCEALTTTDLAKFGLDKPTVRLTVTFKDTVNDKDETVVRTLALGKDAGNSLRFARLENNPNSAVYVIPDSLAKEADKPALARLDRTLLSLDANRVAKIAVTAAKPEDAVTLVKDKDKWTAEGKPFAVDSLAAVAFTGAATRPIADSLAAYSANLNFAEYGLDKPEAVITVTPAGEKPTVHTIKLGKAAPTGGRYGRVDDGPAVAIFAEPVTKALMKGPLDFVDRTLISFDATQLAGLVRQEGNETVELVPGVTAGWEITQPAKFKADAPLMDELAEQLGRLRAVRVAAYEPKNLAEFGLDTPHFVITAKVGLEKPVDKVLKLGNETDEDSGDRYATLDGRTVGVLPGDIVRRLTASPLKFRDRTLAKFVDADRATVVRGDRTASFAKVNGTWKLVKPVTADAEQGELDELINAVAKLRAEELVDDAPADAKVYGFDKPDAIWTFANGETEVLKLTLGGKDRTGTKSYAKTGASTVVARLDANLTKRLEAEYRKRAVWTGVDAAQIETVAVSAGNISFAFRKVGPNWSDTERNEPVTPQAVTELLDALAGLKAVAYVADTNADLKLYGLAPPERVFVLTGKSGPPRTLHVGRAVGGAPGKYYARVADADRTDVFIINETDAAKLMRDRAAYGRK